MMNAETVIVYRLTETTLDIDGLLVYKAKNDMYYADNGEEIGSIRLRALYEYLAQEAKFNRIRFYKYVDNVIKNLLYNEH